MSALTNSILRVLDASKGGRVPAPILGLDPSAIANCLHPFQWEAMTPHLKVRIEEALHQYGIAEAEVSFEQSTLVVTFPSGEVFSIEQALRAR